MNPDDSKPCFYNLHTFKTKSRINLLKTKIIQTKHLEKKIILILISPYGFDTLHYDDILMHLQTYQVFDVVVGDLLKIKLNLSFHICLVYEFLFYFLLLCLFLYFIIFLGRHEEHTRSKDFFIQGKPTASQLTILSRYIY